MKRQARAVSHAKLTRLCFLALFALVIFGASCSAPEEAIGPTETSNPTRYMEVRRLIKKNFHYNFECWCMTGDPNTVTSVKQRVTEADIPVLLELLADQDHKVAGVASSVVEEFGDKALPPLRDLIKSLQGQKHRWKPMDQEFWAREAAAAIEREERAHTPTSTSPGQK